jgi:hypothetical protein
MNDGALKTVNDATLAMIARSRMAVREFILNANDTR